MISVFLLTAVMALYTDDLVIMALGLVVMIVNLVSLVKKWSKEWN